LLEALGLEVAGPATLRLEQCLRFPWRGGLHPWLDAVVETADAIVAIESKRYEPFRSGKRAGFSSAYLRPVWGTDMERFLAQRDLLMSAGGLYASLDAVQLVKHALGLATQARKRRKRAILVYLHAEPEARPDGRPITAEKIVSHRHERDRFAAAVADDYVAFHVTDYRRLIMNLAASADPAVRLHAERVLERFAPL
jgi:hypothetical protein